MTGNLKKIVLLPGDGIGPEIVGVAVRVLKDCAAKFGHQFEFAEFPFGGSGIDATGMPLPAETLAACKSADAILLGAVGGPKWDAQPIGKRPESGLLALRKDLDLYINLRPIDLRPSLLGLSPLHPDRAKAVHIDFVRELASDIYFGDHRIGPDPSGERAVDEAVYTTGEVERVAKYAFARAESRTGRLHSIDKANVMTTSQLWRQHCDAAFRRPSRSETRTPVCGQRGDATGAGARAIRRHPGFEHVRRHFERSRRSPGRIDWPHSLHEFRAGAFAL